MADDDRFLKRRNGWWYVRVRVPPSLKQFLGTHVTEALHTKDKTKAREMRWAVAAAIKAKINAMKSNAMKASSEVYRQQMIKDPYTFEYGQFQLKLWEIEKKHGEAAATEFAERSLNWTNDLDHGETAWFAAEKFDSKTEARYRHAAKLLSEHLQSQGIRPAIQRVDVKMAMSFRSMLVQQGKHRRTAESYLSALRSRWQHWVDGGVVEFNPWRDIRMPKLRRGQEPPRRMWQDDELVRLFNDNCSPALFDYMAILLLTGCRRDEILDHAELDGEWLSIRGGKTAAAVRRVPVAKILQDRIASALVRIKLESRSGNGWTQHFLRYRRSIGLASAATTLHSFRHTFSSLADDAGVQKHHVKSVVGHAKGDTTDIYLKVSCETRRAVVEAVSGRLPHILALSIARRFGC